LERLQRRRERVVESHAGILPDALDPLSGKERRRLFGMLRLALGRDDVLLWLVAPQCSKG
jgi:hypothetical protein